MKAFVVQERLTQSYHEAAESLPNRKLWRKLRGAGPTIRPKRAPAIHYCGVNAMCCNDACSSTGRAPGSSSGF